MSEEKTLNKLLRGKIHYGWIALITVGLYYSVVSGLMINCNGILFAGIIEDMGFKTSELSLYYSVKSIFSAFVVQKLCRMFDTTRKPNAYMALMGILAAASFALMPFYTKVWHWYISAILASFAGAQMVYVVSVVINNWFKKNQGALIGFTLMSSGIVAAVFGPVLSSIISTYGWRTSCYTIAGLCILLYVIPSYFLLVRSPQEVGEEPFGAGSEAVQKKMLKSKQEHVMPAEKLWLILELGVALPTSVSATPPHLALFATSAGYALSVGAAISSFNMIGNMLFKPLMGICSDRIGAVNTTRIFLGITAVGLMLILRAGGNTHEIYAGAFLFGCIFSCSVTAPSLICREMYGDELYKERLSKCQSVGTLMGAASSYIYPVIYDSTGTWMPMFGMSVFFCIVGIMILTFVKAHVRQKQTSAAFHNAAR